MALNNKAAALDELGEYEDENSKVKVNFAKGDFNLQDSIKTLNFLKEKSDFFNNKLNALSNKDFFKLAKIVSEIIKIYYNSGIVIKSSKEL